MTGNGCTRGLVTEGFGSQHRHVSSLTGEYPVLCSLRLGLGKQEGLSTALGQLLAVGPEARGAGPATEFAGPSATQPFVQKLLKILTG